MYGLGNRGRTCGGKRSFRYEGDESEGEGDAPGSYDQNQWNRSSRQVGDAGAVQLYCPLGHYDEREMKWFDSTIFSNTIANGTPTVIEASLFNVPQGATASTRLGNRIVVKSIQFRLHHGNVGGAGVGGPVFHHILVVHDAQNNGGTTYTLTDMFNASNMVQPDLAQRFTVMKHYKKGIYAGDYNGYFAMETAYAEWYRPCSIPVTFSGSSTAPLDHNVFMFLAPFSVQGAATNYVSGIARIRYIDA